LILDAECLSLDEKWCDILVDIEYPETNIQCLAAINLMFFFMAMDR